MIFRRALEPVRQASTTAAAIGPTSTDVRLPETSMPAEVVPLSVPPPGFVPMARATVASEHGTLRPCASTTATAILTPAGS